MSEEAGSAPCAVTQVRKQLSSTVKRMGAGWKGRSGQSHKNGGGLRSWGVVEANLCDSAPAAGLGAAGRGPAGARLLAHPANPLPRGSRRGSWASSYQGRFLILDAKGCCCLCAELSMAA